MKWLLLFGIASSVHLGEVPPAPSAAIVMVARLAEARFVWDATAKSESRQGWLAGANLEVGRTWQAGIDYHHRDGGLWTKDDLWVRGGYAMSHAAIFGRQEIFSRNSAGNAFADNRSLGAEVRLRTSTGRFFVVETTHGILWYRQIDQHRAAGYYANVLVGFQS